MTEILTELDALWAAFEAEPFDALNGPALADRLEEGGEDALAYAVRWMAAERKRPCEAEARTPPYEWWRASAFLAEHRQMEENLDDAVFDALSTGRPWRNSNGVICSMDHLTFRDAVADLAGALAKLRKDNP